MTHRSSSLLLAALALGAALFLDLAPAGAHPAAPPAATATAEGDASAAPATEPAPAAGEPMELDTYQLVLLKRPAERAELPDEEVARIQAAHLNHIRKMAREGYAVVAGPFGDQDDERLRGLVLYRVGSVEEARRLAEEDPAVRAGRLEVEVMTWYTEKGALAFPGVEGLREDGGPQN